VSPRLEALGITGGAPFWEAVRGNVTVLSDARAWWTVVAGDIDPVIENAGLTGKAADLLPPTDPDPWDVIVANLPYIPTGDLANLGPEIQHEPVIALDGGPDGFDVIRRLLDRLPRALAEDGIALLEIGSDQGVASPTVVEEHLPGWRADVLPDLGGRSRILGIRRP